MPVRARLLRAVAAGLILVGGLAAAGSAGAEAVLTLHRFADSGGRHPWTDLLRTADGTLYGTTVDGGQGAGTVFRLAGPAVAGGSWRLQTLHGFRGGADGATPLSGLVAGAGGVLYGTTESGGGGACSGGCGTVFALTPRTGGGFAYAVIHRFETAASGARPSGRLALRAGTLYGTTSAGGRFDGGTVFALRPGGGPWRKTILHNFRGGQSDGKYPRSGVVFGPDGALYGTTETGGRAVGAHGTVFRLAFGGGSGPQFTLLHRFAGGADGEGPIAPVALDAAGAVYGTTPYGGTGGCFLRCGTVFRIAPTTGGWAKTTLHRFRHGGDGSFPRGTLVIGAGGALYGTASRGGLPASFGTLWRLDPPASAGAAWTIAVLHRFAGTPEGAAPIGGLTAGGGALWGATRDGGTAAGAGTVFRLVP